MAVLALTAPKLSENETDRAIEDEDALGLCVLAAVDFEAVEASPDREGSQWRKS